MSGKKRRKAFRLALRTTDLADMFGVKPNTITMWIYRKHWQLTKDPIKDLHSLIALMKKKGIL